MTGSVTYRVAPPGFSREQWREFRDRGIVIIENALTPEEIAYYRDADVPDRIPLRLRKRRTAAERFTTERRGGDR